MGSKGIFFLFFFPVYYTAKICKSSNFFSKCTAQIFHLLKQTFNLAQSFTVHNEHWSSNGRQLYPESPGREFEKRRPVASVTPGFTAQVSKIMSIALELACPVNTHF